MKEALVKVKAILQPVYDAGMKPEYVCDAMAVIDAALSPKKEEAKEEEPAKKKRGRPKKED